MPKESQKKSDEDVALEVEAYTGNGRGAMAAQVADELIKSIKKGEQPTKAELLKRVGYSRSTIKKQTNRVFSSKTFRRRLKQHGLPEKAMKVVQDAMFAKQTTAYKGEITETDLPDHKIRLRAAKQIGKWLGIEKVEVQNTNVNVDIDADTASDILLGQR